MASRNLSFVMVILHGRLGDVLPIQDVPPRPDNAVTTSLIRTHCWSIRTWRHVLNGKRIGRTFAMVVVKEGSPKLLLTAVEAAEQLTVSPTKIYELMAAGTLRSIRIGRLRRVPVDALKDFIDRSVDQ